METVFIAFQDISITENHIKQLHHDLLHYSKKDERHRDEYKKASNSVAAYDERGDKIGIVFETATPFDTPRLMAQRVDWFSKIKDLRNLHPLFMIAVFIVVPYIIN